MHPNKLIGAAKTVAIASIAAPVGIMAIEKIDGVPVQKRTIKDIEDAVFYALGGALASIGVIASFGIIRFIGRHYRR
jgi:hypothetical protein